MNKNYLSISIVIIILILCVVFYLYNKNNDNDDDILSKVSESLKTAFNQTGGASVSAGSAAATGSRTNNLKNIITVDVIKQKIKDIIENDEDFIKGSLDNLDFKKLQKLFIELLEDGKITKDEQDKIDDFIKKVIIANVREKQKEIAEEKLRKANEQKDQILNQAREKKEEEAREKQEEEARRKAEEAERQEKEARRQAEEAKLREKQALELLQRSATTAVNEGNDDGIELQQQQELELQKKQDLIQKEMQEKLEQNQQHQ